MNKNNVEERSNMIAIDKNIVETPEMIENKGLTCRINNMLNFKPDVTISKDIRKINKTILNDAKEIDLEESTDLLEELQTLELQSKTSTTMQKITKIFNTNRTEESKIIDISNENYEASLLDIFRYPNIRRNFLLLTLDWISLGVIYNSLSYNTSNLGVNDHLAFFIG